MEDRKWKDSRDFPLSPQSKFYHKIYLNLSSLFIQRWIKINDIKNFCFVGNDAVAFNLRSHILFTTLTTGEERSYRADLDNGDGVACMVGHKVFPIFAFAENCWNARIFIISYPEFTRISILESEFHCLGNIHTQKICFCFRQKREYLHQPGVF